MKASPRAGFAADIASAAKALRNQPSVPFISLAVMNLHSMLRIRWLPHEVTLVLLALSSFFTLGWRGAERAFFLRHIRGMPVTLGHLVMLVPAFVGRFFALGVLITIITLIPFWVFLRASGLQLSQLAHGASVPLSLEIGGVVLTFAVDFLLTFVTAALAFTTRSAGRALEIGLGMIRKTWPRSALYVLCPPLALTVMQSVFPLENPVPQVALTCVLVLLALVTKGAIAAFYLRERGSYGDDGAAHITHQVELRQQRQH